MRNPSQPLLACIVIGIAAGLMHCVTFAQDQPAPRPAVAAEPNPLRIGSLRVNKVLILGNSITLHGPKEDIGWTGNWGMAASAREKDYVHLLLGRIGRAARGEPQAMVRNIADFERQYATYDVAAGLKPALEFRADVVVLAIGENVPALKNDEEKAAYLAALSRLLSKLKEHGPAAVIVRSSFWPDAAKDETLKAACQAAGGIFVDIGALGRDEANYARAERKIEHAGVAAHPGDKGMQAIADALWKALETRSAEK